MKLTINNINWKSCRHCFCDRLLRLLCFCYNTLLTIMNISSCRSSGSSYDNSNLQCNCGDPESQSCIFEDLLPGGLNAFKIILWSNEFETLAYKSVAEYGSLIGMKGLSGSKRKMPQDMEKDDMESLYTSIFHSSDLSPLNSKRSRLITHGAVNWEDDPRGNTIEDSVGIARQNSPLCSSKSPCAVERCLSKGFEGLLSTRSFV